MAIEITMPKLSDTMSEGLFAVWRKQVGDRIERGDIIAEVETDKAVMELEAFASGILIRTLVQGGETVPVGGVLGLIGEAGELADTTVAAVKPVAAESSPATAAAPKPAAAPAEEPVFPAPGTDHEKASPLVRRLAREQGIALDQITGSGPEGRITERDLAAFTAPRQEPETPLPSAAPPPMEPAQPVERAVPTPMRQAISSTVTQSWQTIPHFSVSVEINMDACREVVRELKEQPNPVGYNALVIKACAVILQKYPLLHVGAAASSPGIHIGFAVSKPDGVLMPVIRNCERLTAAGIEIETTRLADRSRAGRLTSEEMTGASFSVSNLGMYGVEWFTALIMPGQAGILAVGAVRERPVVRDGRIEAAATMRVTLSSDHRSVDGAYAASFLAELRAILEKPVLLLV